MKTVRNIILDLGAVLFDISYNATQKAFQELHLTNPEVLYSKEKQAEIFDQFETGVIDEIQFLSKINELTASALTLQQFQSAWNAMLIGITGDKIEFLKALSGRYNLYLLSNTNPTHIKRVFELIDEQVGLENFTSCFKKLYLSHEIGLRKPHVQCFDYVISDAGLVKEETLFVDDTPQHVQGALNAGIEARHLADHHTVIELLGDLLT